MKPGRLPEDDPEEQKARAKLRQLSPEAQRKIIEQRQGTPTVENPTNPPNPGPQRWK